MAIVLVLGVLPPLCSRAAAQSPNALPIGEEPPQLYTLTVGEPAAFTPAELPVSVICDDLTVLRVEDAGTFLRLTGLKPGSTQCSFGTLTEPGRRRLYRFTVNP